MTHDVWQDMRHGIRVLLRAPRVTAISVITLGVGIGASTTIFSALNGVLLRPLPYHEPSRLVALGESNPAVGAERRVSAPDFIDWWNLNRTLDRIAAYRPWGFVLTGSEGPERVLGARVSATLFPLLGVGALHGRTFLPDEDRFGSHHVVLVSEELWVRRFGADPGLVGRSLRLNNDLHTVVGIIPAGFQLPQAELWVPLAFAPYEMEQRGNRALEAVGRLKDGVALAAARDDLNAIARDLREKHPDSNAGWDVTVTSLHQDLVGKTPASLALLFASATALLLIACANLGNLALTRNVARRRELAIRAALGASRRMIVQQLATESLLTAVAGGGIGLLIAIVGTRLLTTLGPEYLPRAGEVTVDARVLGFAVAISLLTGLGLGVIPARGVYRLDLGAAIKTGDAGQPRRGYGLLLRAFLVVGQVALALVLLVGAGLLVRSIGRVLSVETGYTPAHILSLTVSLPDSKYPDGQQRIAFFHELTRRVAALPGVLSAGLVSHLPLSAGAVDADVTFEGLRPQSAAEVPMAQVNNVDPGYFHTMQIPIVSGRPFDEADRTDARAVAIVDRAFVDRFWPNENPLGHRIHLGATLGADTARREIVGVVAPVRSASLESAPRPTIYVPHAQNPWPTMSLIVRTAGHPAAAVGAVRAEILALDPNQPVYNVRPLEQMYSRAWASRRFQVLLLGGFAATALFLAVIGVYGLLALAVAQRTREVGIRLAVGAGRGDILTSVLRQALALVGCGLLMGGAAALAGSRLLTSLLFEVSPLDPLTFLAASALLTSAGLFASYLPARQAMRVDPVVALRRE
jgi:putative ABC transport system permease protein